MKEQSKMVSYVSKEIGISILLPQEWITQVVSQGQVRFFGLQESGFEQYFEEYRSTMSYLLAEPEDKTTDWFESLIANSASQMKHDYNEYKLIFEEYHEVGFVGGTWQFLELLFGILEEKTNFLGQRQNY